MRSCVIFAGGDLQGRVQLPENALIICADCGYRHAKSLGLQPDVIVGDFDSCGEVLPEKCEILRHPPEKDETDTLLAVRAGRERGCREFHIYGAFGGARPEHSAANVQMLFGMALDGLNGTLYHGQSVFSVQVSGTVYYPAFRGFLSLFSLTDLCEGLTLRGVKYPLEDGVLRSSFPLGVSNEIVGERAEITLKSGALLVIRTYAPDCTF
jgi:thiamine pyrophosphokinase